jgi:poly(A) polymerase
MAEKWKLPTDKAVYRFHRDLGDAAVDTVYLNLADYLAARGPALEEDDWAYRLQVAERILRGSPERQENKEVSRLVDGKDIMTEFNIPSGPRIGELIAIVEEAQGTGEVTTKQEAFTLVARRLKVGGNGA